MEIDFFFIINITTVQQSEIPSFQFKIKNYKQKLESPDWNHKLGQKFASAEM